MRDIPKLLSEIAIKSSTLYERLGEGFVAEAPSNQDKILCRKNMWLKFAAEQDWDMFSKRLAWDGLDEKCLTGLLGDPEGCVTENNNIGWMSVLEDVLAGLDKKLFKEIRCSPFLKKEKKIPFEEILAVFVIIGMRKVDMQWVNNNCLLSDEAIKDLQSQLFERLAEVSQRVLLQEFKSVCESKGPSIQAIDLGVSRDGAVLDKNIFSMWIGQKAVSDDVYCLYVQGLLEGGLTSLFVKYPVMARLMAEVTCFWIDFTTEFITALSEDQAEIISTYTKGIDPEPVISVKGSLSDTHNYGRAVLILEFSGGQKLVYKPRNLGVEYAYFQFLSWLNEQAKEDIFKILKVINKKKHGWVEYCEHLPCDSFEEVRSYYGNCGMLLAVLYILAGSDFHMENIIANGQFPVAIDLEVIMQPSQGQHLTVQQNSSVLQTMLLPFLYRGAGSSLFSGEGLSNPPTDKIKETYIKNINTDNMFLASRKVNIDYCKNTVFLKEKLIEVTDYTDELVEGFKYAYRLILSVKDELLSDDGPLKWFRGQQLRYVNRSTQAYSVLLYNSLSPEYLVSGIERSIRLDKISRVFLREKNKPLSWDILKEEHMALSRLDVPIFYLDSTRKQLNYPDNGTIYNFFGETPLEAVISQIENANSGDLSKQVSIIKTSLKIYKEIINRPPMELQVFTKPVDQVVVVSKGHLLAKVHEIANHVVEEVVEMPEEPCLVQLEKDNTNYKLEIMGSNFYNGSAGILLFLAAVGRVTGQFNYFEGISKGFRLTIGRWAKENSAINNGFGIGGIIYAFIKIWQLTGDRAFLLEARQMVSFINEDKIECDEQNDLISGAAGTVLGLLQLYQIEKSKETLRLAVICGQHLLKNRIISKSGLRAWKSQGMLTINSQPLTGFSHGAAGIAHALGRLYRATGDTSFREGAREALLYEDSLFSQEEGNWPDLRLVESATKPGFSVGWCHGAPGILLCRLEAHGLMDENLRQRDIDMALKSILRSPMAGSDDLCCGNFGLIDILNTASFCLDREYLYREAVKRASWYFQREREDGNFLSLPVNKNYSLFKGLSGIGYVLLRLIRPELPSVLSFK